MSSRTIELLTPGTIASIPTASLANLGSVYYATDEEATYQCVQTGATTFSWKNVGGIALKTYLSSSLVGWNVSNGNGTASINGGFKVALTAGQSSSAAYPDTTAPKYYRDISADIAGVEDFTIWVRIVSATLASDQNIGIALGDSSDTTNVGICAFTGVAGQLTCTPFASSGYIGAPAGSVTFDGAGWIGISRRGGIYSALAGIGTTTTPPTEYVACMTQTLSSAGYAKLNRLTIWPQKFGGGDMDGVFDDVRIYKHI